MSIKKILFTIVFTCVLQPAIADTDLLGIDTDNNVLAWTTTAAIVADWGITLDVENHPGVYEENTRLGKKPPRGRVHTYFIAKLAGHWWINTDTRVKDIKNIWNIGQLFITVDAVNNSYGLGLRVNF